MLDQLRHGDTVIVWKLDRLARSTRDLLETMETIREAGARFESLSEPWANTTHGGLAVCGRSLRLRLQRSVRNARDILLASGQTDGER
jgi:DNA invertase Pin-like site-specific DNA recombinase